MANPFRPGFGVSPLILAGRDGIIDEFSNAIADGPGSMGRATLYTGARGTGKTVLLNEAGDVASGRHGWVVINETATPGFVTRMVTQHLPSLLEQHDPGSRRRQLTGITAPLGIGGLAWESTNTHVVAAGLRNQLETICALLTDHGTGLAITLDEVHHRQAGELRDFFTAIQHLIRDGAEIAIAAAGLPSEVSDLLNDDVLTFLRRADRHTLGAVSLDEVERTLRETIQAVGRTIDPDACTEAARATGGYPFLIQLVGLHIYSQRPASPTVSLADVVTGVPAALRRMGSLVHAPALADLSSIDRSFLLAMAHDPGPSTVADIASRLNVDPKYVSVYRQRLIDAQMIEPAGRGRVTYSLPHLRDYLIKHGVVDAQRHGEPTTLPRHGLSP